MNPQLSLQNLELHPLLPNKVYYKIFVAPFLEATGSGDYSIGIQSFGTEGLVLLNQTHGNQVYWVSSLEDANQEGDGLITDTPNLVIGVKSADCVPVLLASKDGKVIGALHCGWKGAIAGLISNTIERLRQASIEVASLKVVLGPCIHIASYAVDEVFRQKFLEEHPSNDKFFTIIAGRLRFDLPGYVMATLNTHGITDIHQIPHDTYVMEREYPSYRRSTERGQEDRRRIVSAICLCKPQDRCSQS